jgi:DNA polymerase elongation subunit (family B)
MKKKIVFDIETYPNYVLFSFKEVRGDKFVEIEAYDDEPIDRKRLLGLVTNKKYTIIGFNSRNFDLPIICAAIQGASVSKIKEICDHIIETGDPGWMTMRKFNIRSIPNIDHIDIQEPSPGVGVSLKMYGTRLHTQKLQELPIDPSKILTRDEANQIRLYCRNDLDVTEKLYLSVENEITLREKMSTEYGTDLRSLSGAQIAKAVFKKLLSDRGCSTHIRKVEEGYTFKYQVPSFISFENSELNDLLSIVKNSSFTVNDKGSVVLPDELKKAISFCDAKYKIGIGGLHSQEKKQAIEAGEKLFGEFDIASMYPNIILTLGIYPSHLDGQFLDIFEDIVTRRMKAKHSGDKDTADSLKLVINSTFGLFGNKYNLLYSPELLIQVTITGQLFLLMAIEKVTNAGGKVVSANTDGINVLFDKSDDIDIRDAITECELDSGLDFEFTPYKAVYSESVNSYVAITTDNKIKTKGFYAKAGLMKNPTNGICVDAVLAYLTEKTPLELTIKRSKSIESFITSRRVTGGASYLGEPLGKVVRFYHVTGSTEPIRYLKNGNKVAKSEGAYPLMDLPDEFPIDIDYDYYISEADSMLKKLGVNHA